jgi:hypothetical protein
MNVKDTLERLWWTVVSAAGGGLLAGPLLSLSVWQAAGVAGLAAAVNFITIVARKRLSVLPDPGAGLPGLPTDDAGAIDIVSAVIVLILLLIILRIFGLV